MPTYFLIWQYPNHKTRDHLCRDASPYGVWSVHRVFSINVGSFIFIHHRTNCTVMLPHKVCVLWIDYFLSMFRVVYFQSSQSSPDQEEENYFTALSGLTATKIPRLDFIGYDPFFQRQLQQLQELQQRQHDVIHLPIGPILFQVISRKFESVNRVTIRGFCNCCIMYTICQGPNLFTWRLQNTRLLWCQLTPTNLRILT